jgi:SpoIID/LytB domain protein
MDNDQKVDWGKWITQSPNTYCSPKFIDEKSLIKFLGDVDEDDQYFRWNVHFTQKEFCEFFSIKVNENVSIIKKFSVINRGKSGRINTLNLEYQLDDGSEKSFKLHNEYDIRKMLHPSFLYSSSFIPNVNETQIEFKGAGWGHGVGMCQIGALGMALNGYSADKILSHYFQNSSMKKLY